MTRRIMRVPLDLRAATGTLWPGYVMPERLQLLPCPDCARTGAAPARRWASDIIKLLLKLENHRRGDRGLHPALQQLTGAMGQPGGDGPD